MKSHTISTTFQVARILSYSAVAPDVDTATGLQLVSPTNDMRIQLEDGEYRDVPRAWFGQTVPSVGGFLLLMNDGSIAYAPKAFMEKLIPVLKETPVVSTPLV